MAALNPQVLWMSMLTGYFAFLEVCITLVSILVLSVHLITAICSPRDRINIVDFKLIPNNGWLLLLHEGIFGC